MVYSKTLDAGFLADAQVEHELLCFCRADTGQRFKKVIDLAALHFWQGQRMFERHLSSLKVILDKLTRLTDSRRFRKCSLSLFWCEIRQCHWIYLPSLFLERDIIVININRCRWRDWDCGLRRCRLLRCNGRLVCRLLGIATAHKLDVINDNFELRALLTVFLP